MIFYMISHEEIERLRLVMKRLYTEERMHGDQMRDAAHTINAVISNVEKLPLPEEVK